MLETGERFGTCTLARILSPAPGHEAEESAGELDCFGAGRSLSQEIWKLIVRQLIGGGYLEIQPERFGALRATKAGRRILLSDDVPVKLTGTWYEIAPQVEIEEYSALTEGQRDRLPESLKGVFSSLRDRLANEIEAGEVREAEIVRILEARTQTFSEITAITDNPVFEKVTDDILSSFTPTAEEELSFEIEI